jgi:hypothetical protein
MQGFTTNAKRGRLRSFIVPKTHHEKTSSVIVEESPKVKTEKQTLKEQAKKFSTSTTKREQRLLQQNSDIVRFVEAPSPKITRKKATSKHLIISKQEEITQPVAFPTIATNTIKEDSVEEKKRFEVEQIWYGAWKGYKDNEVVIGELQQGVVYLTIEPISEKLILDDSFAESTVYLDPEFCPKSNVASSITYSCQSKELYELNNGTVIVEPTGRIRLFADPSLKPFTKGNIISFPYSTTFSYKVNERS